MFAVKMSSLSRQAVGSKWLLVWVCRSCNNCAQRRGQEGGGEPGNKASNMSATIVCSINYTICDEVSCYYLAQSISE